MSITIVLISILMMVLLGVSFTLAVMAIIIKKNFSMNQSPDLTDVQKDIQNTLNETNTVVNDVYAMMESFRVGGRTRDRKH